MKSLDELKEALENGLDKLETVQGGKLKMGELEAIKMITSSLDHIENICERDEDAGHSGRGRSSYRRGSYAGDWPYAGDGNSYRNQKRDNMGRYSRAEAKEDIMAEIDEMMSLATDDHMKDKIRKFRQEMRDL